MPCTLPPWPHSSTLSSLLASLPSSPLPSPLAPPPPSSRSASASDSDQPLRDSWQPPLPKSPHTPCALCARLRIPSSMVSFLLLFARSCGRRIWTWEWSMCSKKKLRWLCGEREREWNCRGAGAGRKKGSKISNPK